MIIYYQLKDAYDNLFVERILTKCFVNNKKCWLMLTSLDSDGYHIGSYRGKAVRTHKKIYVLTKGDIPKGMVTDHLCRNRNCCNPDHIEIVTNKENIRRGMNANSNKTHCPQGHEYTPENIYLEKAKSNHSISRHCKICRSAISKRQWEQKVEVKNKLK